MKILVISFEDAFSLKGLPFLKTNLPEVEITGLLARNVAKEVYEEFSELPIFEKKITQEFLVQLSVSHNIDLDLVEYLSSYEEQIFYHINRYFDTTLAFDYSLLKNKLILYVLDILHISRPDLLYFGVTPHDPVSYILYLVTMYKKIEIVIITENTVFNSYVLYKEIGKQMSFIMEGAHEEREHKVLQKQQHVKACLDALLSEEPSYMSQQRKAAGSILRKVINSLFIKKRVTLSGWKRYKRANQMKKAYEALSQVRNDSDLKNIREKIIFFPLHFQPELTTSPDGGFFSQQWLAVKKISETFKEGYIILVKEHPSQFMINSKPVRSHMFYEALLSIAPNISLASLSLSSKAILENVAGVSTITGTVGFEALLHEKPVLFFGDARFSGISGTYDFNEKQGMTNFEKSVSNGGVVNKENVISDFEELVKSKFYYCYNPADAHEERTLEAMKSLLTEYLKWRKV